MDNKAFKEEDKEKFIEFLNFVHNHATWGRKSDYGAEEQLKFVRLLSYMQQSILTKIDANIFEVKRVVEAPQEESKEEPKKRGRPRKK